MHRSYEDDPFLAAKLYAFTGISLDDASQKFILCFRITFNSDDPKAEKGRCSS